MEYSAHAAAARPRRRPLLLVEGTTTCEHLEPRLLLSVDVLTYHNDNARTGDNLAETTLTPANVNAATFGKLAQVAVDGQVYAQPLIKTGVTMPDGSTEDLVFVATEHDSVYAFDANTLALVWQDSFINPAAGVTTVPSSDLGDDGHSPRDWHHQHAGDRPLVEHHLRRLDDAHHPAVGRLPYAHQIHALDLATGAEKFGGPVTIQATVAGRGEGASAGRSRSTRSRNSSGQRCCSRAGVVYVCLRLVRRSDPVPRLGDRLQRPHLEADRGAQRDAQRRGGRHLDERRWPGRRRRREDLPVTGNGTFSPATGNYGDTVLKLAPTARGLKVADYFTPYNQKTLDVDDEDLNSGGVMLLPNQPGRLPHLMVAAGKQGTIYLINRDNMGHYNARKNPIVQTLPGAITQAFDTPAYFNGTIYYAALAFPPASRPPAMIH